MPLEKGFTGKTFEQRGTSAEKVQSGSVRYSAAMHQAEPWYRSHTDLRGCCTAICYTNVQKRHSSAPSTEGSRIAQQLLPHMHGGKWARTEGTVLGFPKNTQVD